MYNNKEKEFSSGVLALTTSDQVIVGADVGKVILDTLIVSNTTNGALTFDLTIGTDVFMNDVSVAANSLFILEVPIILNAGTSVKLKASSGTGSLKAIANLRRKA